MSTHTYSLRSRLNGPSPSLRSTPTSSPVPRSGTRSPRKQQTSNVALELHRIIGTTTNDANGLTCCASAGAYAYCAGSVAVLARLEKDGTISHRYYKARPTVNSLNPTTSYYDSQSSSTTPTTRKRSNFTRSIAEQAQSASFCREWLDESTGQTWTARERIKAARCVAISPEGTLLAVGEAGYSPRVLLFSTAQDAPTDLPLSVMTEHNFGVRSVAFSPDSKYLASLGDLNDGFLFVWALNPKTGLVRLHATNKCTTNICDMAWCGNSLITVGTRHVKVWQIPESSRPSPLKRSRLRAELESVFVAAPTTLTGRNCLLGSLVDATFTSIASISENMAVAGTDSGYLCLLENTPNGFEVKIAKYRDHPISAVAYEKTSNKVVVGGRQGIEFERLPTLRDMARALANTGSSKIITGSVGKLRKASSIRRSLGLQQRKVDSVVATGCLSNQVVCLDVEGNLQTFPIESGTDETNQVMHYFAAHDDVVQGVQVLPAEVEVGDFFTWSKTGKVKFWNLSGKLTRQEQVDIEEITTQDEDFGNELRLMRYLPDLDSFMTGDRCGVIKLISRQNWETTLSSRAHSAEVTDIAVCSKFRLIATCGRDRMVQLFRYSPTALELIQTMDDHIGAVSHVVFTPNGERLLSCSSDRTIIVREKMQKASADQEMVAYLSARVITLKATPLAMVVPPANSDMLTVTTMDRYVVKLSISNGSTLEHFKVADPENDDTVILNSICVSTPSLTINDTNPLIVGFSSTDKSIRVYDLERGILLSRESGHTEGVSDVALLEEQSSGNSAPRRTIVSTGIDGTIMIWRIFVSTQPMLTPLQEISQGQSLGGYESDSAPPKASPASLTPMRKILTKIDMADFVKNDPSRSPVTPRASSPARLVRKPSRLNLSSTVDEKEVTPTPSTSVRATARQETPPHLTSTASESEERGRRDARRSPSPPAQLATMRPKKQRSRTEVGRDLDRRKAEMPRRSPSPISKEVHTPSAPKNKQRANNGRLRRPPSIPTDLRSQAATQARRRSTGNAASDMNGLMMAAEQACKVLKTYRKKLSAVKDEPNLDELEEECQATLKMIAERKAKASKGTIQKKPKANTATENDMNALTALLEKTTIVTGTKENGRQVLCT